ncbi:MAG: tyrosine-protein phosphatase [Armatimonadota bacterium]|nr:tyrosine-protein phosphatase [Armatimonadota bacterium]MDR7567634.1 tyrosine-protein phosphatase [Armatimonadota bacterium]
MGKAKDVAALLREGERVVVHCGAGIGRTGMVATAVLMALGLSLDDAEARIKEAGSEAETDEQKKLLRDISSALR